MRRYVIDASVLVEAIGGGDVASLASRGSQFFEPSVLPYEVANVLRKLRSKSPHGRQKQNDAVSLLMRFPAVYWPWDAVAWRVWELHHNLTSTDASYVAVAEMTGSTLVTRDRRLAAAPGIRCAVEVLP